MSKLLKLLEWVTVPQAAKHLSTIVGEEVSEPDVLRLALDRRIALSVHFVNHAKARRGKVIPLSEAEMQPFALSDGDDPHMVVVGNVLPDGERVLVLDDEVVSISGVWDLPMIGCESLDVEHKFQELTSGPDVTLGNLSGTFVQRADELCQLQDNFNDIEYFKERLKKSQSRWVNYYPAGGLPPDAVFVIRTAELVRFQTALSGADNAQRKADGPVHPRSETTYLNVVGALLELLLGKTPAGKAQSVYETQIAIIDALIAHNPNAPGISKSKLDATFADARRRLHST